MTKRGHDGKTVVCSEKTRARGKVKSLVLAVASVSAVLAAPSALAASITVDNTAHCCDKWSEFKCLYLDG